jgi:hypothetical protein
MIFKKTERSKVDLQIDIEKVKTIATILYDPDLSDEITFELLWKLAFVDLRDLEEYRISD